jgi:beta-lactamase superfamily II metal-dependent hydrolase
MAWEIDFLPVEEKSGDAIALRWGNLYDREQQQVMVVDGGWTASGEQLVEHIRWFYGTRRVDYVVSSHPHDDHIQGLFPVLESMEVRALFIHQPWMHVPAVINVLNDNRTTVDGTRKRLRESFACAVELVNLARNKGIAIVDPFEGVTTPDGVMTVLGPSREFYTQCIAADVSGVSLDGTVRGFAQRLVEKAKAFTRTVRERWDRECLLEPPADAVSPLNHSSTILHFDFGDAKALLTADAGVQALERAASYAEARGIDLRTCGWIQVPHHGSRRNVGPSILNRIVGPPLSVLALGTKTAMLSCAAAGEPKHPSARVTNAFYRRGAPCYATKGGTKWFHSLDAPPRPTYGPADPVPFREAYVEEE